jgi:phosphoglycolate phosphatase
LHAAALLRLDPRRCVYVGDDLRDVTAGNAAGMATIVAEYGYLGEQGCADDWPATGWIDTPLALLDWLPQAHARWRADD